MTTPKDCSVRRDISDEVLTEREVDHLAEDESETGTVCEDDLECEEVGA